MSTVLSCIGRTELNWNTVIQLQSTYQFHPEACDKMCLSLVSDSGEIKILLLQQGERLQCGSLCRGREGCVLAVCTGRLCTREGLLAPYISAGWSAPRCKPLL